MKFEPGKTVEEFEIDGKNIVFRYMKMDDVEGLMNYINTMGKNREYLATHKIFNRKEEEEYVKTEMEKMNAGKKLQIVVELDGEIAGESELVVNPKDAASHTAEIGIGLLKNAQGMGIGTRLLGTMLNEAKRIGIKVVELSTMSLNERALHVYEKMGFKQIGRIPGFYNHYGKYCDRIILYMEVPG